MTVTRISMASLAAALVLTFTAFENAGAQAWNQLSPTGDPTYGTPSRILNSTVYNTAHNRMIIFAGGASAGGYGVTNDVWVLTNADGTGGSPAWTRLQPTGVQPGPREAHAAVYDQVNNRMIVHGGYNNPGNCGGVLNDVWILSNADGVGGTPNWSLLSPTVSVGQSAPGRRFHGAAYDAVNNRLIINGGGPDGCGPGLNDTWVLSNANGLGGTPAWTQLAPSTPSDFPSDTSGGNIGYDPATNRLMRFVQFTGSVSTWLLSNANGLGGTPAWSHLTVNQEPTAATWVGAQGVYDQNNNALAYIGGALGAQSETWKLANANGSGTAQWTQINSSGTPPDAREWAFAVYAPQTDRLIMYGGSKDGWNATTEVWVLSSAIGLGQPTLQVSPPTDIVSTGTQGGPFTPSSFDYVLSSSGGGAGYSITGIPSWLNASLASGTANAVPVTVTFTVTASANAFAPGTYNATISFTNTTNGQGNTTRAATLTVLPVPVSSGKDDCKNGGWRNFTAPPGPFKNQGQCVSYFAHQN